MSLFNPSRLGFIFVLKYKEKKLEFSILFPLAFESGMVRRTTYE